MDRLDPLLRFLLGSGEEVERRLTALLAEHARPIVRKILHKRFWRQRPEEAADIEGEVLLRVLKRLRRLKAGAEIRDFRSYVAVSTFRACAERRQPSRESPLGEEDMLLDPNELSTGLPAGLLWRDQLAFLWAEVRQLPPRQRASLLLNLRDDKGRDALWLLPLTGIATMREIAEALGMPAEQLGELWNLLPLEDARIAQLLNVSRQQVINFRKSARARLARRLTRKSLDATSNVRTPDG